MSIGAVLATARRQAGLTTTQVSQQTRIREGIVRGIEADDFSACGGDFYARGHIRAIAASVGTDPEPLVREYDSSHGLPSARVAAGGPGSSAPLRPSQRRRPHWGWSVALLAVLAALAGLATYHFVAAGPAGSSSSRRPHPGRHRAQGRAQAPGREDHPGAARDGPCPRRGDLGHRSQRTLLGRPHHTGRREDLRGHRRYWHLEDVDGTAGSHPEARQPGRGHPDRRRQKPHRARIAAAHPESGT